MTPSRIPQLAPTVFVTALFAAACANPKRVDETPITVMRNGDRIAPPARVIDAAAMQAAESQAAGRQRIDSITADALAHCAPAACAALGRGEVTLGMDEAQVLAATSTTYGSWSARRSGEVSVLTPRDRDAGLRDAVAPIALVQMTSGSVSAITYREPEGLWTKTAGNANDSNAARTVALVREGDALAAAGDFTSALNRYDRASVIGHPDAELQYRIATALDKLLRPVEAKLRYEMFLNQLAIQKIDAQGNANAKLGEAIARAQERIVVLEKR